MGAVLVLGACLLSACGSGGEGSATGAGAAQRIFPSSPLPHASGPPPKQLVIRDLVKGKGTAVPPISSQGQVKIVTLYNAVDLASGEIYEERWDPRNPYVTGFDSSLDDVWEQGLPGMKAGGRRELVAPASMSFDQAPLAYVIELLRVEKGGTGKG